MTTFPVAALVDLQLADYGRWLKAFHDHEEARKKCGILGHRVNRGVDDPNRALVLLPASNADQLRAFFDSADLKTAMQNAGVKGTPAVLFNKVASVDMHLERKLPAIIVRHEVGDYAAWRTAYDQFDEVRSGMGIVGHAVSQSIDNPNMVTVYHQAEAIDSLRRFVDSPELREAMQSAGVSAPPDIVFVQAEDIASY